MNRVHKRIIIVCFGVFLAAFAVSMLAAHMTPRSATPLFIFRMEQASSEKSFLPTEKNAFTYITEKGYNLTYQVCGGCSFNAAPLEPPTEGEVTCDNTCPSTCKNTCPATCLSTCANTCVSTCYTCVSTCPLTCVSTCYTCVSTCPESCVGTCYYTCGSSCGYTCGFTCNTC